MTEGKGDDELRLDVKFAETTHQVLNNEAYKAAMTLRKAELFEAFSSSTAGQEEVREEAWRTMQNLRALEDYLREFLMNGKVAEQLLNED